ncbi:hypothetical protein NLI96_g2424 [Meripilus lineatus]|uniref:DUF1793-domain-containing protein n=1 Tax=Meripilus lineatus TaxID=2056292 RepID=A0AAD5VAS6_9APHY|nr:hypothetical protein NLI96_g2424 [Physisporinus lineatus]
MLSWSSVVLRFLAVLLLNGSFCVSQRTSGRFSPSEVPLGIKSPYFNCWVKNEPVVPQWPTFWNNQILGWSGFIRVDNVTWEWLGSATTNPNISVPLDLSISPTRTVYTFRAGPMDVKITFLTPIEPADPVKQSLPFTYIYLEANSTDSQSHTVQVYSDVSAEWNSGNRSELVVWETHDTGSTRYHQVQLQQQQTLVEYKGQAEDVTLYFAMPSSSALTSRIGIDNACRSQFASSGSLSGGPSTPPGIIDNPFQVFAHSVDLGRITSTSSPIVWSLGVVRNPLARFRSEVLSPYFATELSNLNFAIDTFVGGFAQASQRATDLDNKILNDASSVSQQYADLVSFAARQTIGGTDLTITNTSGGGLNSSNVRMLMKDVGTSQRVNPVEILYSSFPFFLYMNATYAGYLLSPLLEYQDGLNFSYAARDIGTSYPLVTGNTIQPHAQQVEQTGNMLIMTLAHARISGDGTLINRHYELLKSWSNYLVGNLFTSQTNADSETSTGNTNLIIKGVIGIAAMAQISKALNNPTDAQYFSNQSSIFYDQWRASALSSDQSHILANFGDSGDSWSLMYNLYADKLLGTKVVGDDIYQLLTNYLKSNVTIGPNGFPVDSISIQTTNAAWTLFTAAIVNDTGVRDSLINPVWNRANASSSSFFPPAYRLDSSSATVSGPSSPAMGGMYSILALNVPHKNIVVPSLPQVNQEAQKKASVVGPAVGGTIGGLALVGIAVLGAFLWRRRARRLNSETPDGMREAGIAEPFPIPYDYNPHQDQQQYSPYRNQQQQQQQLQQQHDLSSQATHAEPSQSSLALPQTGVILSSKAREAAGYLPQRSLPSNVSSGPATTSTAPASSREPPSEASGHSAAPVSPSQVEGLRAEVENLRRVMQEMRAERLEAPPNYHDIQSQGPSTTQPFVPTDPTQPPPPPQSS